MIHFWNSTVTLYSKMSAADGSVAWKRSVHTGCFWKQKTIRGRSDGADFKTNSVVCRIPAPYPDVNIGDIIVFGAVNDDIDEYAAGKRSADILKKYARASVLIAEVRENARGIAGTDHLYAGG